jgi:acetylglutamate kinase
MDNVYLIKFGGNAIRGRQDLLRLSDDIHRMIRDGAKVVLVHGGGPEISEEMERRGVVPRKAAGLRITDEAVLDLATGVLRRLNAEVVACLEECGVRAVGIPGYFVTQCVRMAPVPITEDGVEGTADLGLVGEVSSVDAETIFDLLAEGITPVVYPIGAQSDMQHLNVNADTMAAGIAAGIGCREMIAITDVPGIMTDLDDPSSKLDVLTLEEVDRLIRDGIISGGMIPKAEACRKALLAGVPAVRMVNGKDPESIVSGVMNDGKKGTVIKK